MLSGLLQFLERFECGRDRAALFLLPLERADQLAGLGQHLSQGLLQCDRLLDRARICLPARLATRAL